MKRSNITWSVKGLCKNMDKNKIDFDCAIQRGLVWNKEQKSNFIHSILYGYSVPPISLIKKGKDEEGNDLGYDSLDGKQRSNTLYDFLNNRFALVDMDVDESMAVNEDGERTGIYPFVYDDEDKIDNISGMTFDQLPEWAQDRFKDYSLTIYYFEDMTAAEIREYFSRLNNGKALSNIELTRVKAVSIAAFQEIANHPAIADYAVTDVGKNRYKDELIAMYIYGMDTMPEPNFSTKAFRPWIQGEIVNNEMKDEILHGLDYVSALISSLESALEADKDNVSDKRVFKKIKTQNNFTSIAYAGLLAGREGVDEEKFTTAVYNFFNCATTSTNSIYNSSVGQGSAKAENVQKRIKAMQDMVEGLKG